MEVDHEVFHTWGEPINQDELTNPRARSLANAISRLPFVRLLEVRRKDSREGLIVEFEVELPQYPPVPILSREHILIALSPDEDDPPEVYALRRNFPETPHQNLTPLDKPKGLCLFEEEYRDIKPQLTPQMLLQRIGSWLARAAVEGLHLSDQPLEPLLLSLDRIVFDPDIFETELDQRPTVAVKCLNTDPLLLRAYRIPEGFDIARLPDDTCYLMLPLIAPPWHARVLSHRPLNLRQLGQLLGKLQVSVEAEIRAFIIDLRDTARLADLKELQTIILLQLQKTRTEDGPIESPEWWAFLVPSSIEELAIKLDIMGKVDGTLAPIVGAGAPQSQALETVPVAPLRPTFALSKPYARLLSGLPEHDPNIVVIGAGALGSQVILNLARQGFGTWAIVDHDYLLPHNLARHGLSWAYEGRNKAEAIAFEIQRLMNDDQAARSFASDILKQLKQNDGAHELITALQTCDVILDFSTSHAVSRAMAYADYPAGRICAFLSPSGHYLILLSEGQERSVRLDDLEMQLAAAIAENRQFHSVYMDKTGSVAYAGSCRDTSFQLAQDLVAIHAAVASQFIKASVFAVEPSITLWKWSDADFSVTRHYVPVHGVAVTQNNGWTIRTSSHVGNLMRYYRRCRLPNETGGVLLGKMDHDLRTIYIATVLPSPPDSIEWPTVYIRGVQGLREKVERVARVTGGDLSFIGEWHSHPEGCSSDPSEEDREAHAWLAREMATDGLPALIAIQGDRVQPHFLLALDS
jgi:integrative and conjugative element protein (TIGR02256 family)